MMTTYIKMAVLGFCLLLLLATVVFAHEWSPIVAFFLAMLAMSIRS